MADEINRVGIEVFIDDQTASGLQEVEKSVVESSQDIGQAMDQNLGAGAESASGEVTKLSRALGNATDANNLASKSVNRLVRMFNPLNLGIGLTITGIAALGRGLYDMVTGPLREADERLNKSIEDTKELIKKIDESIERERLRALGLTDNERSIIDLKKQRNQIAFDIAKKEEELIKYSGAKNDEQWNNTLIMRDESIQKAKIELMLINDKIKAMEIAAAKERGVAAGMAFGPTREDYDKERNRPRGRGGRGDKDKTVGFDIFGLLGGIPSPQEAMDYLGAYYDIAQGVVAEQYANFENAAREHQERLAEIRTWGRENEAANQEIAYQEAMEDAQARAEMEEEYARRRIEIMEGIGGAALTLASMGGKIASSVAKTEKQKQKAEAVTAVIVASIQAALEVARAIAAYPNVVEMVTHGAAAAAYIAAAALAAKYGGGQVQKTSSTGVSGGAREAYGPPGGDDGPSRTTIVIEGHVFSPEGGADFVKKAMEYSDDQTNPGRTRKEMR